MNPYYKEALDEAIPMLLKAGYFSEAYALQDLRDKLEEIYG